MNMLGLGVAAVGGVMQAMGQIKTGQLALYLLAAAAFLLYTPLLLRRRAKKQMQVNPEYRDPMGICLFRRRGPRGAERRRDLI